jgi:hypothetical protein
MKFKEPLRKLEFLYSMLFKNLEGMDKFLDAYHLPKLNQEHKNSLKRSLTSNDIEAVIKSFSTNSQD